MALTVHLHNGQECPSCAATLPDDGGTHYCAPDGHIMLTGPHTGSHTLADGTVYNVTPTHIEVASLEHAAELAARLDGTHTQEG